MPFTPSQSLSPDPYTQFRDQQHAARLFVDDQFRLAPKHKFLFHVFFNINPATLADINLTQRHKNEIGMLVKSVDLPSYTMTVETANQYNRKKNIQSTHKFNEITLSFHDDNMGVINQLWQNYYAYYYADSRAAFESGAFGRTATKNFDYINSKYGLDNGSKAPFFNYITIYQMARHDYVSYRLVNPIITSWNHNKVDYGQNSVHDNTIKLAYEAVAYGSGVVSSDNVEGFSLEHYDQVPSPLTTGAPPAPNASPSFSSRISPNSAAAFLQTLTQSVNGYQNTRELPISGSSNLSTPNTSSTPGGLAGGFSFPGTSSSTGTTQATQVDL